MASLADWVALTKPKISLLNVGSAISCFVLGGGGAVGAVLLAAAGYLASGGASALNNYLDRDIDSRRTSERPVPSGRITPRQALAVGIIMSASSLTASLLLFNALTATMILMGLLSYVMVYTIILKRRSELNIVIGGAAGSFPPLAGWAAATGTIGLEAVLLALLVFLWTPGHFWALAIRAEADYRAAELPMLPVTRGPEKTITALATSNALLLAGWLALSFSLRFPTHFLLLTTPPTILLIHHTIKLVRTRSREDSWKLFKASSPWLLFIQLGLIATKTL
jgi:protoheme IX farnesyltransferase